MLNLTVTFHVSQTVHSNFYVNSHKYVEKMNTLKSSKNIYVKINKEM